MDGWHLCRMHTMAVVIANVHHWIKVNSSFIIIFIVHASCLHIQTTESHVSLIVSQTLPHLHLMSCLFNDSLDHVWVLSHLKLHTSEEESWTPSGKRKCSYSKICRLSWWVFMLDQKAVWILFEDWLECKASSSASLESLPYEFFSAAAALAVILVVDCVWIVCFMLLSTFSYIVIIFEWPDKLFRSELKVSHLTFSSSLLWVPHKKNKKKIHLDEFYGHYCK